jgi:hypothetical protein
LVVWNHGIFWLSRNSWECHHPNISEIHHFSGGVGQPPSRLLLTIINHIVNLSLTIINHIVNPY